MKKRVKRKPKRRIELDLLELILAKVTAIHEQVVPRPQMSGTHTFTVPATIFGSLVKPPKPLIKDRWDNLG